MSCQLILQNYTGSYAPGDTIIGLVRCIFTQSEYVQGVRVTLTGKESTEWIDPVDQYNREANQVISVPVKHYGINRIVNAKQTVTEGGTVGPGTFEYSFQMLLPKPLPNTFRCFNGEVRYDLIATVEFPGGQNNQDAKEILINGPVDLNLIPVSFSKTRTEYSDVKTVKFVFGKATLDVCLEKEWFIIGEPIQVTAFIKNNSSIDIEKIHVQLTKINTETVNLPEVVNRSNTQLIQAKSSNGVHSNAKNTYYFVVKVENPTMLHNLWGCKFFKEQFKLTVIGEFKGDQENLMVEIPVYIGNVACTSQDVIDSTTTLFDHHTSVPPNYYQVSVPSAPPREDVPTAPLIASTSEQRVDRRNVIVEEELPPPSYHEAMSNPSSYPRPS